MQAKLLRVIETGEFIKVGESKPTQINVRIISATNRDLEKEIEDGLFRKDLFYRLSVFQIKLPALRERSMDIEALANYFVKFFAAKTNKKVKTLSHEFIQVLKQHTFPGNIRELKNIIERSVILSDSDELYIDSLPGELLNTQVVSKDNKQFSAFSLESAEKIHIQKVLNYANGNKAQAAKLLEIGVTTLYRKLDEYGIDSK